MTSQDKFFGQIEDDDTWHIVDAYMRSNSPVKHQLDSFSYFLAERLPEIIHQNRLVVIDGKSKGQYEVEFGEVKISNPNFNEISGIQPRNILPNECIRRNITYSSDIHSDIEIRYPDGTTQLHQHQFIGRVPVMVGCENCNTKKYLAEELVKLGESAYDLGGYFIVDGNKKVVVPQMRSSSNVVYVYQNKKKAPKYDLYSEIRSSLKGHTTTLQVGWMENKNTITTMLPFMSDSIPLGVLFRALGAEDNTEILQLIFNGINPKEIESDYFDVLIPSLEVNQCSSQKEAFEYIGKHIKSYEETEKDSKRNTKQTKDAVQYSTNLLENEVLPHLGANLLKKKYFLGHMTLKLLNVITGRSPLEDRDHMANKRITTVATQFSAMFFTAFRKLKNKLIKTCEKAIDHGNPFAPLSTMSHTTITNACLSALKSDHWGGKQAKSGISQVFDQFNYVSSISTLNKFSTPSGVKDNGKTIAPRLLHNSEWGMCGPSHTPEGKRCGLTEHKAVLCSLTIDQNHTPIIELLKYIEDLIEFDAISKSENKYLEYNKVFVNGDWIGVVQNPDNVYTFIQEHTRANSIEKSTSVSVNSIGDVYIVTDGDRWIRPLLVVEDSSLKLQSIHIDLLKSGAIEWQDLLNDGVIDMVDASEQENILIATYPSEVYAYKREYTHCEITPSSIFSPAGSLIPFPDHNQSPRNTYQCAMSQQAVGAVPDFRCRTDNAFNMMNYVQKPLVMTKMSTYFKYDVAPAGMNATIVISPYRGKNQEDSLVFNKASIDRGFMQSSKCFVYYAEAKNENMEEFGIPTEESCGKFSGNNSKLEEDATVAVGEIVIKGDIIIGLVKKKADTETRVNMSIKYDEATPAVIDSVEWGVNQSGYKYVRVMAIQQRKPEHADKFSARHGQKGTIGMIAPADELPFSKSGCVPDIVVNPLAFPSRMTIGMLLEELLGKSISCSSILNKITVGEVFGKKRSKLPNYDMSIVGDGTPFQQHFSVDKVRAELKKLGFDDLGDEEMYDGLTGEKLQCLLFYGPVFYQRLKHMVRDKIHVRTTGPVTMLTRQATEGRRKQGGHRFGTMEGDCVKSHGASAFLKDRLLESADNYRVPVCASCNNLSYCDFASGINECRVCGSMDLRMVRMPYSTKLWMQESMGGFMSIKINV